MSEMLHDYVEKSATDEIGRGGDEGDDATSMSPSSGEQPVLFGYLTSLFIVEEYDEYFYDDPRVVSYVLTHALQLKTLSVQVGMANLDDAFKHIGAQLEDLDLSQTSITDATIDVLCQQLAPSLRRLTLDGCYSITRQGNVFNNNNNNNHTRINNW